MMRPKPALSSTSSFEPRTRTSSIHPLDCNLFLAVFEFGMVPAMKFLDCVGEVATGGLQIDRLPSNLRMSSARTSPAKSLRASA